MPNAELLLNQSPWLILLCLLAGLGYAFFLYTKKSPWSKPINYFLAVIRGLLVSLLCFLLLGPFIKMVLNRVEEPAYVIAIDDSQSMSLVRDSLELRDIMNKIDQAVFGQEQFEIRTLKTNEQEKASDIVFNKAGSNLHSFLKDIEKDYEGRNLAGVVLVSDGIYNQGVSPTYRNYSFLINSVGLGDTIPKKDINLKSIYYNKVAYQGNKFAILSEIGNTGFAGKTVKVSVYKNQKLLQSKSVKLGTNENLSQIEFTLEAEKKGLQHYVVSVEALDEEFTLVNNSRDAYIEIIEGRKRVLLVSDFPHPDIKALRKAIEGNDNYEFIPYISGLKVPRIASDVIFDLVIYYQVRSSASVNTEMLKRHIKPNTSKLFVLGRGTDFNRFNRENEVLKIQVRNINSDAVSPVVNHDFSKFSLSSELQSLLESFPPVNVPFGNYSVQGDSEVLLFQRFGAVDTDKPLLTFRQLDENKEGVLSAEGLWQWRLQDYAKNDSHVAFDELINKTVQYLSSVDDKKRFRAYPLNQEFFDSQPAVIEVEIYNSLYEPIYNKKIDIVLSNELGESSSYSFVNSESNKRFSINGLNPGVYRFTASTDLNGKKERSSGAFSLKKLQLEAINLTGDHNLLRNLSQKTGGQFYTQEAIGSALDFDPAKAKSIIHTDQEFRSLINLRWLLFVFLALISIEWFTRKYGGGY